MFLSDSLQQTFNKQGYIVLPLLKAEEVAQLNSVYNNYATEAAVEMPFYTSIWSNNYAYRHSINEKLTGVLFSATQKYLVNTKAVFANLMVKNPGQDSSLTPHQDWNFVDEPTNQSITVWCPLQNTNFENGTLQILPYSHRLQNYVRGRFFDAPFNDLKETIIKEKLVSIPLTAGEAILLNSRLIHASTPNLSDKTRVAASIVLAPEEAPLCHYVLNPDDEIRTYKKLRVAPDFYINYSCYDALSGITGEQTFLYNHKEMTKDEFANAIEGIPSVNNL